MKHGWSSPELIQRLRTADVLPTLQRLAIGSVMLPHPSHMTAEQVLVAARECVPGISRATVYSTLQMFVRQGLLRELLMDGEATIYDSNTQPHHHLYHVDTGRVEDLPCGQLRVSGLPELDDDLEMADIDVIVRVRSRKNPASSSETPSA
ncbi:MAG: Fur family transcriptional regulator [Pseudomonadota bacterium]